MKCIIVFSCAVLAVFIGQTLGMTPPPTASGGSGSGSAGSGSGTVTPSPCGSHNGLEGYKGACDESVPVIVLPKGRPILERILDWFRCCTGSCNTPTEPTGTATTAPGTSWPPTSYYPPSSGGSATGHPPTEAPTPPTEKPTPPVIVPTN